MGKPTALILGCNYTQIPYVRAARGLGFRVVGVDRNPDAPGRAEVDAFYPVGYTDFEGLEKVVEKENLSAGDKIFTAAAHLAYEGAARLAELIGIPFPPVAAIDTGLDKTRFYALLGEQGIAVPSTQLFDKRRSHMLDPRQTYFLKSDYGKSPTYCYRIENGILPSLPKEYDAFFRRDFLLQEEVLGDHYRVNIYGDQAAIFLKLTDHAAVPLRILGPGHLHVLAKLRKVMRSLALTDWLVKFDLIVTEQHWYVIDLGLDPPMRLRQLCEYLGIDFPMAYARFYLLGERAALPAWVDICRPLLIEGSPEKGFVFTDLGEK